MRPGTPLGSDATMSATVTAASDWRQAASAPAICAASAQARRHSSGGTAPRPRCRISLHVYNGDVPSTASTIFSRVICSAGRASRKPPRGPVIALSTPAHTSACSCFAR